MKHNNFTKRFQIVIAIVILLMSVVYVVLQLSRYNFSSMLQQKLIPSWNGITPGKTSSQQVIEFLGQPDQVEDAKHHPTRANEHIFDSLPDYQIFIYRKRIPDWGHVEIWIKRGVEPNTQIVTAILLTLQDIQPQKPIFLIEYVKTYGRPDDVTWTLFPGSRYLIWATKGIAVSARGDLTTRQGGELKILSWNELPVDEILFFEPTTISEFYEFSWPWPNNGAGWSSQNLYPLGTGDSPDTFPKDPYDWNNVP